MLRQWKNQQREQARAALPLSDRDFEDLFETLDRDLAESGCDHTRRLTVAFLEQREISPEPVLKWLDDHGGYCDCEVLANVEKHWEWCRGNR